MNLARWRMMHSGPLTTNIAEAGGFSRTDPRFPAPDLQWHVLPTPYRELRPADPSIRALSVLITLVAVGSRGRIRLRSADPRHKPDIDPAYLSDGADIDPLVRGIRLAREIAATGPLAKICKGELAPGPDVRTDVGAREFIRRDLATLYHPVGTCAMGGDSRLAASKLTSVVDTELRVRGVDGLRVVDASVMPVVPGATPTRRRSRSPSGPPTSSAAVPRSLPSIPQTWPCPPPPQPDPAQAGAGKRRAGYAAEVTSCSACRAGGSRGRGSSSCPCPCGRTRSG